MFSNLIREQTVTSGQLEIREHGKPTIYLFTNYTGNALIEDAFVVLSQELNWDAVPEFTKLLFCQMIPPEAFTMEKGYGITTSYFITDIRLVFNMGLQTISIFFNDEHAPDWAGTFERFIGEFTEAQNRDIYL